MVRCADKTTSVPPVGYIADPAYPPAPWKVLQVLRVSNPPFGSRAQLVCPVPTLPDSEPYWSYYYPN